MRRHAKALVAALTLLVTIGVAQAIADTAPTPTMEPVSSFSYTSAHLEGEVDPNGGPSTTAWQFQYSSEGPEGPWTPGPEGSFEGTEAEETTGLPVQGDITGLKPNTTYYTRLVATNEGGQSSVSVPSFTTLEVQAPSVTIEPVSSFTSSSAQLVGHINPNAPEPAPASEAVEAGFRVQWSFQCTPECPGLEGEVEADESSHEVSAEATGLKPGTEYDVTLIAKNAGAEASAGPESFTAAPGAPQLGNLSVSDLTTIAATLNSTINPAGDETTYRFEYVDQAGFEASEFDNATKAPAPDASVGSGATPVDVTQEISGLTPNATYHYRLIASNAIGGVSSDGKSFKTYAATTSSSGKYPGQGFLPDNRAWEMVSPPSKNGGGVIANSARTQAASDGSALGFVSLQGFADAAGSGSSFEYVAQRTEQPGTNGWSTHAISPLQDSVPYVVLSATVTEGEPRYSGDFSADLDRGLFRSFSALPSVDGPHPAVAKGFNLYLRTDLKTPGAGSYLLLSDCSGCGKTVLPFIGDELPWIAGANAGDSQNSALTNVIYQMRRRLTPDANSLAANQLKLYEGTATAGDEIQTISVEATAGQFRLDFEGQSTGDLAFDAPATGAGSVEEALNDLPAIAPGFVSVTGGPGDAGGTNPYVVSFSNGPGIASTDTPQLIVSNGAIPLSGGGATAIAATRLIGGAHVRLAGRIPVGSATACDDAATPACIGSTSFAGPDKGDIIGVGNKATPGNYALNAVSGDGSRIVFIAPASGTRGVYLREDGLRTIKVNASEAAAPSSDQDAKYWTASSNGSRIFFSTGQGLIDEDTNDRIDLYMYDASRPPSAPDNLTLVSKGSGDSGDFGELFGAADDGSHVYFTSGRQLVAGEPDPEGAELYLWQEGVVTYIGGLGNVDASANGPATRYLSERTFSVGRVTPDGQHFLFTSTDPSTLAGQGGFAGFANGSCELFAGEVEPCRQLFLYSADTGQLRCVSCHSSGGSTTSSGDAFNNVVRFYGGSSRGNLHLSHALSDGGRYVFFHTGERLVPEDRNGSQIDVYRYDTLTGSRRLISSGESSGSSYFLDASDDGGNVFFTTNEQLSRWDVDSSYDIYDARIGGGLAEPSLPSASCQGDACQPAPVTLNDSTPSSASFHGQGDPVVNRTRPTPCLRGKRRVKTRSGKARCVRRTGGKRGTDNGGRASR